MNLFITIPIAFILFMVILYRPFWGLLLVIAASQLEYFVPIGAGWSMGRLLGMAVAFGWFGHIIKRRGTKVFEGGVTNILLMLYIVITAVGVLASVNPASGFSSVIKLAILIVMVFFIQDLIESRRQLIVLLWVIAMVYGLSSVPGIIQYREIQAGAQAVGIVRGAEGSLRYAGLHGNPNAFGIMLMSAIPFLVLFIRKARNWLIRIGYITILTTCLFSLFLTASRTHIFAFVAFVLAYFATEIRFRTIGKTEIAILFALIFMTGVALVNVPEFAINRIVGTNLKTDTSTAGRYSLFHKGFSLFLKNPLLGVGLYNSANHGPFKGTDMHDTFAVAFGETGLLGTIALLTIIIVTIIKQGRMIKELRASGDDFLLRTALITRAAFVAILVSSFGNIIIYRRIFWIYIALTNVLSQADLYRLYQREKVE